VRDPPSVLLPRTKSDQPDERREALQAIAADRSARVVPEVVAIFCLRAKDDPDPMVRSAAVHGLADMDGPDVIPTLGMVLARDGSPYVRVDAAAALGRHSQPECMAPLAQALRSDEQGDVRIAAAEALRGFRDKSAAEALVAALADEDLAVAQRAWESLRYMTGQDLPRQVRPWGDFLASATDPFQSYGKPPPVPAGQNQRPRFTKGPLDFIKGLFAKDVNQAELE
jgi:hypothetical protein